MASTGGRAQGKRRLVERALDLAGEGRWTEAEQVNREILGRGKPDVTAVNRLGKALAEQHRYAEALEAYRQVLGIDPGNQIAKKNVARMEILSILPAPEVVTTGSTRMQARQTMFIEEPGRSATLVVASDAKQETLAKLIPGDHLTLVVRGDAVGVYTWENEFVGYLPARIGQRLAELIAKGNEYQAAVAAVLDGALRVVVRETFRSAENGNRLSFPTSGKPAALPRAYTRDVRRPTLDPGIFDEDSDDEAEDDDEDEELEPDMEGGEINEDEEIIEESRRTPDEDELG